MPLEDSEIDRYRRQVRYANLGIDGQAKLRASRIAIVGMGALGSAIAERFARMGIGFLRLIDRDWVELDNLPRQTLYTESDAAERLPKAIAAEKHLLAIDSQLRLEPRVEDLNFRNASTLLEGVDLIMDGTDNFETRYLINDYCIAHGVPWIHGGCVGASGQVMAILPGVTCCFRCLVPWTTNANTGTCDTVGVLGPAVTIVASWQCMEGIKMLTNPSLFQESHLLAIDAWEGSLRRIELRGLQEFGCPSCRGDYPFLDGRIGSDAVVLCGRDSVQVQPAQPTRLDLQTLAQRWETLGTVESNPFLLRAELQGMRITVFVDGRAIISGTTDPALARSIYSRWVGN